MPNCDHYYGKVFAHVASALGMAAGSAEFIDLSVIFQNTAHPILMFFVVLALTLFLVWGLFVTEPGSPLKYLIFVLLAISIGQTLQPLIKRLETKKLITRSLVMTTGVFLGMMLIGFMDDQNTLGFGPYLLGALIGLVIAQVILIFITPQGASQNWISFIGAGLFALLTVYDTQVIKENKQVCNVLNKRGIHPDYPKESIQLFLDFVNLFSNLAQHINSN
jgi:FtsH-binding integral membrane protein